ncbi:type II toxin-antitoxin system VapC family toxin [Rhodoplanes roseus]|uniref:PIN domain-containing protein n=1 Tax=Rhodoplanes roseus TaxID=29409 RepID=A0A327L1F9_9BRAD|nr:PIN domain-containing protein [Rhodoplanes roseus]RAI44074.1 hypothetical protein CH341_11110 [Rhodoplanes roseus]
MAASVLVDAGFLVALLARRDGHHAWAIRTAERAPPPWLTCDAVLSEAFHLLGPAGVPVLGALVGRGALVSRFDFGSEAEPVLRLMQKYADVPMSFADACLVRMTEFAAEPILLTTDTDFRVYRRLGRRTVPCVLPD